MSILAGLLLLLAPAECQEYATNPRSARSQDERLPAAKLEALWADLAGADAARAYEAMRLLIDYPRQAVPFFKTHLLPIKAPDPGRIARLIGELRSARFAVRNRANAELEKLGDLAEPQLRKVDTAAAGLEMRRRVEQLLEKLKGPIARPDLLQGWRAIEILESIATPEAREVLRNLARGAPAARLTQGAQQTLRRLTPPPSPLPEAERGSKTKPLLPLSASGKGLGGGVRTPSQPGTDLYGDPLPAGAALRLGTMRFRHQGWHKHILFAPDGKTVLTAADSRLCVWDAANGKLLKRIDVDGNPFRAVALSRDGKVLASAGIISQGKQVRTFLKLWDATTLQERKTIEYPERTSATALAFFPDGRTLASADSREGNVRLWDVASGRERFAFKVAKSDVSALAISPDGALIASGPTVTRGYPGLWDAKTGKLVRLLKASKSSVKYLGFGPDGKRLLVGDESSGVRLFEVASGRLLRSFKAEHDVQYVNAVTLSPDGKRVACASYGRNEAVLVWDADSGKLLRQFSNSNNGWDVAFSPDSRSLAVATDCVLDFWHLDSGKRVADDTIGHRGGIARIVFTPDGKRVVTASDDHTARLWDTASGKLLRVFPHKSWVRGVAVSPDGRLIATSSLDNSVRLWDAATGREIYRLEGHGRIGGTRVLGFAPDGKTFASWGDDLYLRVWDVRTGKALREFRLRPSGAGLPDDDKELDRKIAGDNLFLLNLGSVLLSPDAGTLFLCLGDKLYEFDVRSGKERKVIPRASGRNLTIDPSARTLLVTDFARVGSLRLYHLPSGELFQSILSQESSGARTAFTPDGKMFAVGVRTNPGRIDLWETATGRKRRTITGLPAIADALAFSPDGRYLVAGLRDSSVLIWDLRRHNASKGH